MGKSLKLFLIGFGLSFIISMSEVLELDQLPEESIEYFFYSVSFTGPYVRLAYYSLLVIILPFLAVPQFKEKLGKKSYYTYTLLSGITFGFSIVGIYTVFTQRIFI